MRPRQRQFDRIVLVGGVNAIPRVAQHVDHVRRDGGDMIAVADEFTKPCGLEIFLVGLSSGSQFPVGLACLGCEAFVEGLCQ